MVFARACFIPRLRLRYHSPGQIGGRERQRLVCFVSELCSAAQSCVPCTPRNECIIERTPVCQDGPGCPLTRYPFPFRSHLGQYRAERPWKSHLSSLNLCEYGLDWNFSNFSCRLRNSHQTKSYSDTYYVKPMKSEAEVVWLKIGEGALRKDV